MKTKKYKEKAVLDTAYKGLIEHEREKRRKRELERPRKVTPKPAPEKPELQLSAQPIQFEILPQEKPAKKARTPKAPNPNKKMTRAQREAAEDLAYFLRN